MMLTTMAMVYDGLTKEYSCSKGSSYDPDSLVLSAYLPSTANGIYNDGAFVVQIGEAGEIGIESAAIPPKRMIAVVRGESSACPECAIVVRSDAAASEVAHAAQAALCRIRMWIGSISDSVLMGTTIDHLVASTSSMLGNPVVLLDRALRIKASAGIEFSNVEELLLFDSQGQDQESIHRPSWLDEFLGQFKAKRVIDKFCMSSGSIIASCRTGNINGDYLFAILIQADKEIVYSDIMLLQFLCEMIESITMGNLDESALDNIGYKGLIVDAIEGRLSDPDGFIARMRMLGCRVREKACLIVAVPQKGQLSREQAHRLSSEISLGFSFGRCVSYKGSLVMYTTYSCGKGPRKSDLDKFGVFLESSNLIAGVSGEHDSSTSPKELYEMASCAITIGHVLLENTRVYQYDDCRPYYMYEVCLNEGRTDFYLNAALQKLRTYDEASKVSLYDVLECFAKNWGNHSKTASALYMQRNTLRSRLNEIETVCGIDLSSHDVIAHLNHSFAMKGYSDRLAMHVWKGREE